MHLYSSLLLHFFWYGLNVIKQNQYTGPYQILTEPFINKFSDKINPGKDLKPEIKSINDNTHHLEFEFIGTLPWYLERNLH